MAGKVGALIITTQTLLGGRAGHHHGSQGAYRLDGLGSGVGGVLEGSRQRPHHLEPCLGKCDASPRAVSAAGGAGGSALPDSGSIALPDSGIISSRSAARGAARFGIKTGVPGSSVGSNLGIEQWVHDRASDVGYEFRLSQLRPKYSAVFCFVLRSIRCPGYPYRPCVPAPLRVPCSLMHHRLPRYCLIGYCIYVICLVEFGFFYCSVRATCYICSSLFAVYVVAVRSPHHVVFRTLVS